jgi:hypothetical protein
MHDYIRAPAIGAKITVDRIDDIEWPYTKIVFGAEDTAFPVAADAPLPTTDTAVLAAIEALFPGTGSLPAGAATDAKLELIRLLLAGVLNVSVSSSTLPAGAATATLQTTNNTALAQIVTLLTSEGGYLDGVEALLTTIGNSLAATLNVLPLIKPWAAWTANTAIDMRNYAGVEIQVTASAAATFTRSANDADYVAISASVAGTASASPLAPGFYSLKGGGFLKWAGTGTILIRGYN